MAEALEDYRAKRSGSLYLHDALDDYARASEVLSRAVEAAYADGDPARKAEVAALMDQRMANENGVIGVFEAAGRT